MKDLKELNAKLNQLSEEAAKMRPSIFDTEGEILEESVKVKPSDIVQNQRGKWCLKLEGVERMIELRDQSARKKEYSIQEFRTSQDIPEIRIVKGSPKAFAI